MVIKAFNVIAADTKFDETSTDWRTRFDETVATDDNGILSSGLPAGDKRLTACL